MRKIILIAGGTGSLGGKIVKVLLEKDVEIRMVVRLSTDKNKYVNFEKQGVKVYRIDMSDVNALTKICEGVSCVVSALSGLRDVIIDAQKVLLDAAVAAKVPRFIPSDYSIDFTQTQEGENRNLDLRREFHRYLDKATISPTTIFNGAFTDLIKDQMPLVLFDYKRILFWGNANQKMDFTTMDDTAEFTAHAALDDSTPRYLRIAGSQVSANDLKETATEIFGRKFKLLRPGGLGLLGLLIKFTKVVAPGKGEVYPAWQGMQYMKNMLEGNAKMKSLDNGRFQKTRWTTVKDFLHHIKKEVA